MSVYVKEVLSGFIAGNTAIGNRTYVSCIMSIDNKQLAEASPLLMSKCSRMDIYFGGERHVAEVLTLNITPGAVSNFKLDGDAYMNLHCRVNGSDCVASIPMKYIANAYCPEDRELYNVHFPLDFEEELTPEKPRPTLKVVK